MKNTKTEPKPVPVAEPTPADFELNPEQHRRATALLAARAAIVDTTGNNVFSGPVGHVEGRHQGELVDLADYVLHGIGRPDPIAFALGDDFPCCNPSSVPSVFNMTINPSTEQFAPTPEPKKEATFTADKQATRDRYESSRLRSEALDSALRMPGDTRDAAGIVVDAEKFHAFIAPTETDAR